MQIQYFACVRKSYEISRKTRPLIVIHVCYLSYIICHYPVTLYFNWRLKNTTLEGKSRALCFIYAHIIALELQEMNSKYPCTRKKKNMINFILSYTDQDGSRIKICS